jgi:hypothetical protein
LSFNSSFCPCKIAFVHPVITHNGMPKLDYPFFDTPCINVFSFVLKLAKMNRHYKKRILHKKGSTYLLILTDDDVLKIT